VYWALGVHKIADDARTRRRVEPSLIPEKLIPWVRANSQTTGLNLLAEKRSVKSSSRRPDWSFWQDCGLRPKSRILASLLMAVTAIS
jgi:hypothetical protein